MRASAFIILALVAQTSGAMAHTRLVFPKPRTDSTGEKDGPCGMGAGATRSTDPTRITTFSPGQTVTIQYQEPVNHRSYFRFVFDSNGTNFPDPATQIENKTGQTDAGLGVTWLADQVVDNNANTTVILTQTVTLPNITCDNCTIQLIQNMNDDNNVNVYNPAADLYYSCADIKLVAPGQPTPDAPPAAPTPDAAPSNPGNSPAADDPGTGGTGPGLSSNGGCSALGAGPGLASALVLLLGAMRRRRRR